MLLFFQSKYINIILPITDKDVAVYGKLFMSIILIRGLSLPFVTYLLQKKFEPFFSDCKKYLQKPQKMPFFNVFLKISHAGLLKTILYNFFFLIFSIFYNLGITFY